MLITDKINKDTIVVSLNGSNRSDAIQELLDVLVEKQYLMESVEFK